jgi:hypothetical protein
MAPSMFAPPKAYWHLQVPGDVSLAANADHAHRTGITGSGVRVAMVDSGWYKHPYFVGRGYRAAPVVLGPGVANPLNDESGHVSGPGRWVRDLHVLRAGWRPPCRPPGRRVLRRGGDHLPVRWSTACRSGGMLRLYPDRLCERLSAIRANPERGAIKLRLMPRQTVVMFGGIVPHAILPVADGQVRIVSVLCYRLGL